jgi:hypothetical protein
MGNDNDLGLWRDIQMVADITQTFNTLSLGIINVINHFSETSSVSAQGKQSKGG